MSTLVTTSRKYLADLAERALVTFLQVFGATLIAGGVFDVHGIQNLSAWQAAAVAGLGAVLSVIKSVVARAVGNPDSASLTSNV
jgi:Putative lactococcus lactis phage r1t holin